MRLLSDAKLDESPFLELLSEIVERIVAEPVEYNHISAHVCNFDVAHKSDSKCCQPNDLARALT
jgi:hypothetical protein